METDQVSGGQDVEASNLEFDLLAFVEENLMEDPNTQFPSNHPDQSETAGNYSTVRESLRLFNAYIVH